MTLSFWRRDCEIHSVIATVKPEGSGRGKEAIAEIGTSPRGEVSPGAPCDCVFLPCSCPRYRTWSLVLPSDVLRLEFQHRFNEIWLLLKTAVLPLFFHSLVPCSCLPEVIPVCVVWLIRKDMIRQKDYLCLILISLLFWPQCLPTPGQETEFDFLLKYVMTGPLPASLPGPAAYLPAKPSWPGSV